MTSLNRIIQFLALTAGLVGYLSPVQAQDSCYMVTSSGQTMNLGHLCGDAASPVSASPAADNRGVDRGANRQGYDRSSQPAQTRQPQGYCEDLPIAQRGDCYNNYDQSGTRVGTTIGGNRYDGSGQRVQQGSERSCRFASQYDWEGRICSRSRN